MGNQYCLKTSVCCHLLGWKNPAEDWLSCGIPENRQTWTLTFPRAPPVFNVVEHKLLESNRMFFFCLFSPFFYCCLNEQYKPWETPAVHVFIQGTTRTLQWTYAGLCLGDCNSTKTVKKKKKRKLQMHCKNMPFIKATKCCALLSLKSNSIFFSTEK